MSAATDRIAKYRRLLPRLVLGRTLYTRGTVTVHFREPFDALCDVTFRLVDAAGRTHAERSEMLAPDSPPVGLGGTVNLPPGLYEVIATPPLLQFWGDVPVEHRMPLTVAAPLQAHEPGSTDGPADAAARVATVRAHMDGADPAAAWARLLDGVAPDAGGSLLALARRGLDRNARLDGNSLAGAWPGAGTAGGIDATAPGLHARLMALAALAAAQDGDLADWAAAQLDAHCVALALVSVDGLPLALPPAAAAAADAHAALAWMLWGRGVADPDAPVVRALALAGYVPPPVPGLVASEPGAQDIRLAPREGAGLTLHRDGAFAVASSGATWLVALAADVRISGTGAAAVSQSGPTVRARLAAGASIALPFWALDDLRLDEDLVAGRCGDHAFALASTSALRRDPAAPEAALLADDSALVACVAGTASDALHAAARALARLPWRTAADAGPTANAIDSPFCRAAADATRLTIRVGDAVLSLDLSAPRDAADGAPP